jgi:hypothetical protein
MLMKSNLVPAFEGALNSFSVSLGNIGLPATHSEDPLQFENEFTEAVASLARAFVLRDSGILFFTNASDAPLTVKSITVNKDNRTLTAQFNGDNKPITISCGKYKFTSSHASEMVFYPYSSFNELPTCCFKYMTEASFDNFKE